MRTFTNKRTNCKELFRVVDEKGNWNHYYHKPSKTYLRAVSYILSVGYAKGDRFENYLKNGSKEEIDRKFLLAGEKGDKVHDFIAYLFNHRGQAHRGIKMLNEETLQKEMLTPEEWSCIISFQEFWKRHEPVLVAYEFSIYNLKHGFGGTGDAILILTKKCEDKFCPCNKLVGKLGLFDWKSGAGVWNSFGAQLAFYANGENISNYIRKFGKEIDYTAILRLGTRHTKGYELRTYNKLMTEIHWGEALASIRISNASYRPFDPKRDVYDVPDNISIVIRKTLKKQRPRKKVKLNLRKHVRTKSRHKTSQRHS